MSVTSPLQQGLFEFGADGSPHLLANRCNECALTFFPRRVYCGRCGGSKLGSLVLSRVGKVFGFSFVDRKPAYAVIDAPYIEAEVTLPEGVHVFTVLDQCKLSEVSVGMAVEMYVSELPAPKGEGKVLAYKFRPVRTHSAGGVA